MHEGEFNGEFSREFNVIDGGLYECVNGYNNVQFRVNHFPSMSTDSYGDVHVSWMSYDGASLQTSVKYANAANCGVGSCTFNTPVTVNTDLERLQKQFNLVQRLEPNL